MRLGAALALAGAVGCASGPNVRVPPNSPFASRTLGAYDAALRHYVVAGDSTALATIVRSGTQDSLIRLLSGGLYLHRLGRYEESNAALQAAEALAEDRYTKSVSQNVAAFMVSDLVVDYTPPALERAMIHYYGMINYLALGNLEEALVEARRVNAYLDRYNRDNGNRRSYSNDALVQYLAGLLHWTGGDDNDALVSLRQADAAFDAHRARYRITPPDGFGQDLVRFADRVGVPEVADEAAATYGVARTAAPAAVPTGELMVVVENGFIAHRMEEKIYIPITRREKRALGSGSIDSVIGVTANVLVRTLLFMNQTSAEARSYLREYEGLVVLGSTVLDADLFSFAWTRYELDAHAATEVTVAIDGDAERGATVVTDLSAIASRDYEEQKPKFLARMIARGLFKQVAALKAEATARERGGAVAGFLTRLGSQAAATLSERADTRSWSLLPAELRVVRFSLPAGTHQVTLRVREETGGLARVIDLGPVEIRPNRLAVRTAFVTGRSLGDLRRFRAATAQVNYETPAVQKCEP